MTQTLSIALPTPPDLVWPCISTGPGIASWFAPACQIVPGVGGSITLSWGPGMEGTAPITAWDEGRHVAWEENGQQLSFTLQADGAGCQLQIEDPGLATRSHPWLVFAALLRHHLAHHPQSATQHECSFQMTSDEIGKVWVRVLYALGLREPRVHQPYSAQLGGVAIQGQILAHPAMGFLALSYGQTAIGLFVERIGGQIAVTVQAVSPSGHSRLQTDLDSFTAAVCGPHAEGFAGGQ